MRPPERRSITAGQDALERSDMSTHIQRDQFNVFANSGSQFREVTTIEKREAGAEANLHPP